jgi:hypothetical protein
MASRSPVRWVLGRSPGRPRFPAAASAKRPLRTARLPVCRSGKNLYVRQNATRPPPCMRWRGPCFGLAVLRQPVARPPQRRAPPAGSRHPCDTPVSRSILTSAEVAPSWCPFPTVKAFLRPLRVVAQGSAAIHFKFLPYPHDVHKPRPLIRTSPQLSTALCTRNPQVARCNLARPVMPWPYVIAQSFLVTR